MKLKWEAPMSLYPFVFVHEACGNPAFLLARKPRSGEPRASKDARHLDGSPIAVGEACVCGSCNATLGPDELRTRHIQTRQ